MSNNSGDFSKNIFSLELQIKTLLDGAGGNGATELLDNLSKLRKSERNVALKVMNNVIKRILEGNERFETANDIEEKVFEETLYKDIMNSFFSVIPSNKQSSFSVLDGGRTKKKKKKKESKRLIDFEAFRVEKMGCEKPKIN